MILLNQMVLYERPCIYFQLLFMKMCHVSSLESSRVVHAEKSAQTDKSRDKKSKGIFLSEQSGHIRPASHF